MRPFPKQVLLDTNVLLLWLAGLTSLGLFKTFKRVGMFRVSDFLALKTLLRQFPEQVTTPHVLAEVSNFCDQAPALHRLALMQALRHFVQSQVEHHTAARLLSQRDGFLAMGVSDTGLEVLADRCVVITTDHALYGRITSANGNAILFQHYLSSTAAAMKDA